MTKFLCIDYGLERTGLAVSDPEGKLAFPLATLSLKHFANRGALLDALCDKAREEGVEKIVLGLPLYEDGSENLTCRQVRNFAERIKHRLSLPIYFMPEALSSEEALSDLREAKGAGLSCKKRREILDQQAACGILASFLNLPENRWMQA